jgi:hypothetical protein
MNLILGIILGMIIGAGIVIDYENQKEKGESNDKSNL